MTLLFSGSNGVWMDPWLLFAAYRLIASGLWAVTLVRPPGERRACVCAGGARGSGEFGQGPAAPATLTKSLEVIPGAHKERSASRSQLRSDLETRRSDDARAADCALHLR
eukprot:4896691-Pyramimonas_sp.AAC.1